MIKFKCPNCGHNEIEQVMVGAIVVTPIVGVDMETDEVEYGSAEISDGLIDTFQCVSCGYALMEDEAVITDEIDLVKWLKKHEDKTS